MSADSPNQSRTDLRVMGPNTISPQHVTDPTILDSVAGFINEVVPTAYQQPQDSKDQIQWAHFEQLDCDESTFSPNFECEKNVPPPLILVLGYTNGIQIWAILANGEATEILSWRHGSVKVMKVLSNPYVVGNTNIQDIFSSKRPLVAVCDSLTPGSQFCSLNFLSLKTSEQVKLIKFKTQILNVLCNRKSVAVTFSEKIAIFDAFTLEDRLTVTTCYLSPGLQPNPIALGTRWMAYAEKKLNSSKRSSGGNEGEGIQSYTATVLHAAKSLGRGLRELGETVASSFGAQNYKPGTSPNSPQAGGCSDVPQKGIITILDIESNEKNITPDSIVAHFTAHTEAIVCLQFDPSGLLLLTADKRGHDFHLFRIHPHPGGPSLAAVHHLYVLHRGDTTAKVQDMCFSPDSRWVAVSSLRGTSHVFPITPYGGNVGVRTHATPHVVNKMSRFHRSAGLTAEGRSNSPVSLMETPITSIYPYNNPRFPPFPYPTVVQPLAQIRQPIYMQNIGNLPQRQPAVRQRIPSSSEENISLRLTTIFAPPRAWIDGLPINREAKTKVQAKPVESLFIMSCHGALIQYDLEPHPCSSIPKEKVCDDSSIELTVTAKAQWTLQRQPHAVDIPLPLSLKNLNYVTQDVPRYKKSKPDHNDDHWLSQVEIVTHAGPHRRLWMGPQFTFKTYTTANGSLAEATPLDLARSKPVNMPITKANAILIESGSASSCEQSLIENYQRTCDEMGGPGELQLKEDLADAMQESPSIRDTGGRCVIVSMKPHVTKVVNPLGTVVTLPSDDEEPCVNIEEVVILENCDEATFRPLVTPKPIHYTEMPKQKLSDNIIVKNLDNTTEVTVTKLLKKPKKTKDENKNKREDSPVKIKPKPRETSPVVTKKTTRDESPVKSYRLREKSPVKTTITLREPPVKYKPTSRDISPVLTETRMSSVKSRDISPENSDSRDLSPVKSRKSSPVKSRNASPVNKKTVKENQKSSKRIKNEPKILYDFTDDPFDLPERTQIEPVAEPILDLPVLAPLEPLAKIDYTFLSNTVDDAFDDFHFDLPPPLDDADEENYYSNSNKNKKDNNRPVEMSFEEVMVPEEKIFSKKVRKPKTKLGIKIPNANKENNNIEKSIEITIPVPKKSWSSVASMKPKETVEKNLLDCNEKEKEDIATETEEEVEPVVQDLLSLDDITGEESSMQNSSNDDAVKTDKSSDDEKADLPSSREATTTESDDSGKVPPIEDPNEDFSSLKAAAAPTKSGKRKVKKKRK